MLFPKNITALCCLVLCTIIFASCETDRNEVMAIGKKNILPTETGRDITMMYSDSSELKIRLQAPSMQVYEKDVKERMTILPKGLYVVFYDKH